MYWLVLTLCLFLGAAFRFFNIPDKPFPPTMLGAVVLLCVTAGVVVGCKYGGRFDFTPSMPPTPSDIVTLLGALAFGFGLGFGASKLIGAAPAPPFFPGVFLVLAMTVGFLGLDWMMAGARSTQAGKATSSEVSR